jgi:lysine-specific demethylase 6A
MGCARKQTPSLQGFVCLEEYKLSELTQIYDAFILHKPTPAPPLMSSSATTPPPLNSTTTAISLPSPSSSASSNVVQIIS